MYMENQSKILLVDDNDMVRDSTRNLLEALGYTVMEARSGSEAVQIIEAGAEASLVFCDVMMPGMSGFEFAEWVQRHRPSLRILLTSGHIETKQLNGVQSSIRHIGVLSKPYNLDQLEQSIQDVLAADKR